VDPACFSDGGIDASINPSARIALHAGAIPHQREVPYSTPQRKAPTRYLDRFRPVLAPQKVPEFWADKPFTRCLDRPAEWSFRTLWDRPAGPKHTRAERVQN